MAGRIPQSFIDDLLSRVDIVDVVESRVHLKKTGKNYSGLCPFHQEKTPSFTVEPQKQFYYCFGCGAGGNAVGFIMRYENVDYPQAIESLARSMGMDVPREESARERREGERNQALYETLAQACRYYQAKLRKHPTRGRAVDYLKSRGLSGEIARDFGLGYAPPGWDNLLKELGADPQRQKLLQAGGMLIEKAEKGKRSVYDRFRDRVMFPIRDTRGRVIAFGGRVLGDDTPKYLNSPETPVFHKGEELYGLYEARKRARKLDKFLIVEGYMDVIALAQSGIPFAVATLGTATSGAHLRRLFKRVQEVVFCFDGDAAGRDAAWRAMQQVMPLMQDGRSARFLLLPEGEDPDTLVRKIGASAFLREVDSAPPLSEFFLSTLREKVDMGSPEGRSKLDSLAMPLIRTLPGGVYRELLLDRLAAAIGVDRSALDHPDASSLESGPGPWTVDRTGRPAQAGGSRPPARPRRVASRGRAPRQSACMKAVNLILLKPAMARELDAGDELAEIDAPDGQLLLRVIELARRYPDSNTPELMGRIYATPLGSQLVQLLGREQITPHEGVEREFHDIIGHLLETGRRKKAHAMRLEEARKRLESRHQAPKSENNE